LDHGFHGFLSIAQSVLRWVYTVDVHLSTRFV